MAADQSPTGTPLRGVLTIKPGAPLQLAQIAEEGSHPHEHFREGARHIGATLRSYLAATKELLEGKYSSVRDLAPAHMTAACYPKAFIFSNGVLIRYDLEPNPELKVLVGSPEIDSLADLAPQLSESFLHCPLQPTGYDPGDRAVTVTLSASSAPNGAEREIIKQRIFAAAHLNPNSNVSRHDPRPMPLISVRNVFDLMMEVGLPPRDGKPEQRFLMRTTFRIPVGWEAIELYPPYKSDTWDPKLAPLWAERDLLGALLQRNMRENHFHAIDPSAEARKKMARLIGDCEKLLIGNEEPLHQFIKANPKLLNPAHARMWSKLPLGKRETDFVFRQPSGDYLLVELEKPSHLLFRNDGQQRAELTHAIDQVMDWRRYIEDNLATVQKELGLDGISSNPSSLIVIGRSSSLDEHCKRKLVTLESAIPKLKIMTYDDMLANARATAENLLGPLWDAGPHTEVYFLSK